MRDSETPKRESGPSTTRTVEWNIIVVRAPGHASRRAGVLLLDQERDRLHVALIEHVSGQQDLTEVWNALGPELITKAAETGGTTLFKTFHEDFSNFLEVEGAPQILSTSDPVASLQELFRKEVLHPWGFGNRCR